MNKSDRRILADTTVWIEFFRLHSNIGNKLELLIKEGSIWLCGIVMFELLQGVKSTKEKSVILATLSDLPYIEMSLSIWQKAAELSASIKRDGINLPLSDIFIATLAIEYSLQIFTLDKHFEQIPGVKLYKV
ncbi:MAG: PIN domain-containing protein [Thermodesulfobacteriota bacterium]